MVSFSISQVAKWFSLLFPHSAYPPERFPRRIQRLTDTANKLVGEELKLFHETPVDFDEITPRLTAVGIDLHFDMNNIKKAKVTNAIVYDLHKHITKESLNPTLIHQVINKLSTEYISHSIDTIIAETKTVVRLTLKKHKNKGRGRGHEVYTAYIEEQFMANRLDETYNVIVLNDSGNVLTSPKKSIIERELQLGLKTCRTQNNILNQKVFDQNEDIKTWQVKFDSVSELLTNARARNEVLSDENARLQQKNQLLSIDKQSLSMSNQTLSMSNQTLLKN